MPIGNVSTMGKDRHREVPGEAAAFVNRIIKAKLSQRFAERPQSVSRYIEMGLIEPEDVEKYKDVDVAGEIQTFRDKIAEIARARPSVLAELEVRPLELMRGEPAVLEAPASFEELARVVVFSDLEGFTSFNSERGDREAGALLADHYDTVDALVKGRGGRVVKTIGDGHMLSFAEPSAAVLASVELVGAAPVPLRVRTGAHMGTVMRAKRDLLGHVVNVASRVTDLAEGGISLVTNDVRQAAGSVAHVAFGERRREALVGLDDPVEVWVATAV